MTHEEFQEWLVFHKSCFTGIDAWLEKVIRGENAPSLKAILGRWFDVLKDVPLRDAKNATMKIHSGEAAEPKGYDRHPSAVRAIAGKNRPRRCAELPPRIVDGEYAYRCPWCEDEGWRFIAHPDSLRDAREGKLEVIVEAMVACICKAGDPFRVHAGTFDPQRDCELSVGIEADKRRQIKDFLAGKRVKPQAANDRTVKRNPPRRFAEFEDVGAMPGEAAR
ncbi:MAG: hypothetical protein JXB10_09085 [Pirellulales bacterium]|nr:hypothetical protein [Pirellulales bacterium]